MAIKKKQKKEYIEKLEEIRVRLSRIKDLEERYHKGLELETNYKNFCYEKYPLHTLGEDKLLNFLRENKSYGEEKKQYYHAIIRHFPSIEE